MLDTIRNLKQQFGSNNPTVAEQLNLIGAELQAGGDNRAALKFHQEALAILEWNKCNALLYDFGEKSKTYAIDMSVTLRKIGNLLREMNNFVGAAEVYKECLDTFLEALVDGGGVMKRKILECEYKKDSKRYRALLDGGRTDRKTIGRVLCLHPEYRATVKEISQLLREMQCVKFVGQNAASSRRRRKMIQHAAMEKNLKHAAASLSVDSTTPALEKSPEEEIGDRRRQALRSRSSSTVSVDSESWVRGFWEKEMGRYSRPRPLSRRAITSDEEYDHYKELSSMIVPAEECLVIALKRFPLPESVVSGDGYLRQWQQIDEYEM